MLDTIQLEKLIESEIKNSVQQQVQTTFGNKEWAEGFEKNITNFVHARLVGKFNNISAVPDLVSVIENKVSQLFAQGAIPGLEKLIDQTVLHETINRAVDQLISRTLDNLSVDPNWIARLEKVISQSYTQKVSQHLGSIDIDSCIVDYIETGVDRWADKLRKNFQTNGITDAATSTQLSVEDGLVVVENQLAASGLHIGNDASVNGTLDVNNLILRGTVNVDNQSWNELSIRAANKTLELLSAQWKTELVQDILEHAKTSGINFKSVLIDDKPLVKDDTLNSGIKKSSIETVGTLNNLRTIGTTKLNNTLTVIDKRIGINTEHPEMALSVWDEEISLVAGKLSKDHAYIGTNRPQTLSIGVNRNKNLDIDSDGLVTVQKFRIDRWQIGHTNQAPSWSGTRGDIMFNNDPKPDQPFGWSCLGGFRWQSLWNKQ